MTTLEEWRKGRENKNPQGNLAESLEKLKASKGSNLENIREDISKARVQNHQALIEDVFDSAKLSQQKDMLAEIAKGKSIDEVLAKYGIKKT